MTLVVDASAFIPTATADRFDQVFGGEPLLAPPLLWPEVRSALHVALHRDLISAAVGDLALATLESGPVEERRHPDLGRRVWGIADQLGWSKTYDAEYLALAELLGLPLATFDRRMRRAAGRLGLVVAAVG